MARYTDEQEFKFSAYPIERALTVVANGGTLVVSKWDGLAWVIDTNDTITADTNTFIKTQNSNIKLTPTGGATYSIDEAKLWVS